MKLEGQHTFQAPRDVVFARMTDPGELASCIPGCEQLEPEGGGRYKATLKLGIAAIRGTYQGYVAMRDVQPPERYVLAVEGSGAPGYVKGEGALDFVAQGDQTLVTWKGDAEVGGTIAATGQRIIGGVANMLVGQFFKCMEKRLAGG
ncbi:MAG: carbon monoxide dehydrogenase subunit G [Chloroflexi bacterium]|nr:carbon monoxide dehydrogenase subunit G [Chloroflexota bacterium]